MAEIIDMFTRQPIKAVSGRGGGVAAENNARAWFKEWAEKGPQHLDLDDQIEWITMFHEQYLREFLDASEGIAEATSVEDLESFMADAIAAMKKWPKS